MAELPSLSQLLPHAGSAIWLETVVERQQGVVVCGAKLPEWLLGRQEPVSTILGLELAAQAAALCVGPKAVDSSGAVAPGYVAQVSAATFEKGWFAPSAKLEVRARLTDAVGRALVVRAEVFSDGAPAMTCELLLVSSSPATLE